MSVETIVRMWMNREAVRGMGFYSLLRRRTTAQPTSVVTLIRVGDRGVTSGVVDTQLGKLPPDGGRGNGLGSPRPSGGYAPTGLPEPSGCSSSRAPLRDEGGLHPAMMDALTQRLKWEVGTSLKKALHHPDGEQASRRSGPRGSQPTPC